MNYGRVVEQVILSGILGAVSICTGYVSKMNEKIDSLTMSVQEVAFRNESRFQLIDMRVASLERVCRLQKRL